MKLAVVVTFVAFVKEIGALMPNNQGCVNEVATKLPYCNVSLSIEARLDDLMSRMSLKDKIAQITPQKDLGSTCATFTRGVPEIGGVLTRLDQISRQRQSLLVFAAQLG